MASDETFRQMNSTALRSVMQQTNKITNFHLIEVIGDRIETDRTITIDSILSPCGFDALMQHEFSHFELNKEYEYGIIDHLTGKLHLSSALDEKSNLIMQSRYTRNLKNILDTERFSVVVWFPHDKMIILRKQNSWLLLTSILLLTGIVAGYFLSVSRLLAQKRTALIQRDFINNTTHEFKTPLATISIAAEMILSHRKQMPEGQIERYAAIIFDENKRIQHQVDQIMQVSLLENEHYRYNIKPIDLQSVLERCIETGRLMLRNSGGSIKLEGRISGLVEADQVHITNVINNLIENSIKYSSDIPALNVRISKIKNGVLMEFRDKGIGIASDQLSRIFDRMYRVPTGDLYLTPGTGIGLYYVKKVVEAHKGTIKVSSKLGEGSSFEIFLPYQQQPE